MSTHEIHCTWTGEGLGFDSDINGTVVHMDGDHSKQQVTPKKLTLLSLAGCTAMDVISLLKKMQQEVTFFDVSVEAPVTEEHPQTYTEMKVRYTVRGHNLDAQKVQKAVDLSREKYCGVSALLRKAVPIVFEVQVEAA